jgi:hypothetical protein
MAASHSNDSLVAKSFQARTGKIAPGNGVASRHDQTLANRDGNSLRAVGCTEISAGYGDVFLDGALGNSDNCADFPR